MRSSIFFIAAIAAPALADYPSGTPIVQISDGQIQNPVTSAVPYSSVASPVVTSAESTPAAYSSAVYSSVIYSVPANASTPVGPVAGSSAPAVYPSSNATVVVPVTTIKTSTTPVAYSSSAEAAATSGSPSTPTAAAATSALPTGAAVAVSGSIAGAFGAFVVGVFALF